MPNKLTSKQQLAIVLAIAGALIVLMGIIYMTILSPTSTAPQNASAAPGYCKKAGINYAAFTPIDKTSQERAAKYGFGIALEIVNSKTQLNAVASSFRMANSYGIKPILRLCVQSDKCEDFKNPADYVTFINSLADQVNGGDFYAIAGSNESLSETWIGGSEGNPDTVAPPLTAYMNAIIAGVNKPNVTLLSPTFNVSDSKNYRLMQLMQQNGANFSRLGGVSGNIYNLNVNGGWRITAQLAGFKDQMNNTGLGGKPIIITETGMYEIQEGVSKADAISHFREEIVKMQNDNQVLGYLIFNGFGNNTSFQYNLITDADARTLYGDECMQSSVIPNPSTFTPSAPIITPTPTLRPSTSPSATASPTPTVIVTSSPSSSPTSSPTPSPTPIGPTAPTTARPTFTPTPSPTPFVFDGDLPETDLPTSFYVTVFLGFIIISLGIVTKKKYTPNEG